jgi:two-component system LytT family sensor kinase
MLRYQINPHFLFNSLNSVSALIREDGRRAERMLNELSEFLRYSLAGSKLNAVPLRDELEAARNYLDIEKIRFEEKLVVRFDVSTGAQEFRVPSLIIHPLIENAVKYGMLTSQLPLDLAISAEAENGALHLSVTNTGRWVAANNGIYGPGAGIGLTNVRQRLEQAFPNRHRFDVFERDGRVHAVMKIESTEQQ